MLLAINNSIKDFRIEGVLSSDAETLKKFITTYIPIGSNVTTDGWNGYTFLNALESYKINFSKINNILNHPMLKRWFFHWRKDLMKYVIKQNLIMK